MINNRRKNYFQKEGSFIFSNSIFKETGLQKSAYLTRDLKDSIIWKERKRRYILEKLDYLIEYLLKENKNIKITETPSDEEAKKRLYRSLCNIREPRPIKEEYIKIENEYLQEKLQK